MLLWPDGFHQLLVSFPARRGDSLALTPLIYLQRRLGNRHRKIKLCSQVTLVDVAKPILRDWMGRNVIGTLSDRQVLPSYLVVHPSDYCVFLASRKEPDSLNTQQMFCVDRYIQHLTVPTYPESVVIIPDLSTIPPSSWISLGGWGVNICICLRYCVYVCTNINVCVCHHTYLYICIRACMNKQQFLPES